MVQGAKDNMRGAQTKLVKGMVHSRFLVALLLFWLLNVSLAVTGTGFGASADFPVLSWTGWTIKQFLSQKERPNIVFLGSSLVLVPLDGVDADYLNRKVDGSQHHHSAYFEDHWRTLTGNTARTYTFALPGEMPSDAYLIVKNLLTGNKQPDVIVYGVGPRDFLDNLLPSPSATDPFRYLSRFGPVAPIASRVMSDWKERLDFELGRVFSLYGNRENLSAAGSHFTSWCLAFGVARVPEISFDDKHVLLPEYHPCEVGKGQAFFRPTTASERGKFADNLAEYKKRYAELKWNTYLTQMEFFGDTLSEARSRGIKTVVVAMPITDLNRSLLSERSWSAYRNGVLAMAKQKGATVVDLSESPLFGRADFMDTVHLHSGGGKRWLDVISDAMCHDTRILSSLAMDHRDGTTAGGQFHHETELVTRSLNEKAHDRFETVPRGGLASPDRELSQGTANGAEDSAFQYNNSSARRASMSMRSAVQEPASSDANKPDQTTPSRKVAANGAILK